MICLTGHSLLTGETLFSLPSGGRRRYVDRVLVAEVSVGRWRSGQTWYSPTVFGMVSVSSEATRLDAGRCVATLLQDSPDFHVWMTLQFHIQICTFKGG